MCLDTKLGRIKSLFQFLFACSLRYITNISASNKCCVLVVCEIACFIANACTIPVLLSYWCTLYQLLSSIRTKQFFGLCCRKRFLEIWHGSIIIIIIIFQLISIMFCYVYNLRNATL